MRKHLSFLLAAYLRLVDCKYHLSKSSIYWLIIYWLIRAGKECTEHISGAKECLLERDDGDSAT